MAEESVEVQYLSVGANRHTAVADWSQDGLVAFGADSNIALWRPHVCIIEEKKIRKKSKYFKVNTDGC